MKFDFLDVIGLLTTIQLILLAIFLVSYQGGKKQRNRILAVFLFANAWYIADYLQVHLELYLQFPHLTLPGFTYIFLFGPLLYIYTRSFTEPGFSLQKSQFLHALPFLLYWLWLIPVYFVKDADTKIHLLSSGKVFRLDNYLRIFDLAHVQIFVYMVLSLRLIHRYRRELKHRYSSLERLNLSWLRLVLYGFLLMWICDMVNTIAGRSFDLSAIFHDSLVLVSLSINFVFANLAVYRSLKQPELFREATDDKLLKPKYEKSPLTEPEKRVYTEKLLTHMKVDKPHLDPDLSLSDVARLLGIHPRYVSQIINESLGENFFDFINRYRIEDAKKILISKNEEQHTVLEILYEVGFNSKSAFNTAFKRHTGVTPTEFKRQARLRRSA